MDRILDFFDPDSCFLQQDLRMDLDFVFAEKSHCPLFA